MRALVATGLLLTFLAVMSEASLEEKQEHQTPHHRFVAARDKMLHFPRAKKESSIKVEVKVELLRNVAHHGKRHEFPPPAKQPSGDRKAPR